GYSFRDGGSSRLDWADDDTFPEQRQQREDRPQLSPLSPERGKQKPPSTRHFSQPTAKFTGFPGEASNHLAVISKLQYSHAGQQPSPGRSDRQPVLSSSRASTSRAFDDCDANEMQPAATDETHGPYGFHDALPSSRWRLVMVIVVLGL